MVVSDGQWISMAHIEFEITSDEEASLNAVKTVYRTIGLMH